MFVYVKGPGENIKVNYKFAEVPHILENSWILDLRPRYKRSKFWGKSLRKAGRRKF